MKTSVVSPNYTLVIGLPVSIWLVLVFLMKSPWIPHNPTLAFGVTFDLIISVPLVYFLLIRKTTISKATVIPVLILGLTLGSLFLPKDSQSYLSFFKSRVFPFIEFLVISIVIYKVRKAIKTVATTGNAPPDFYTHVIAVCMQIMPSKAAKVFATEVAVMYYGFVKWKKRSLLKDEFSYHQNTGNRPLFGILIFMVLVETFVLHLLVERWNNSAAWILTALSIYTFIQFMGFLKSLSQRPVFISATHLYLRYGMMNEVVIPLTEIESVAISTKDVEEGKDVKPLSLLGKLEGHNVVLHCKSTQTLTGIYGIKKTFKVITLNLDEPKRFKERLGV